jgi:hypothetical protein
MKRAWANPELRQRWIQVMHRPEVRQHMTEAQRRPEVRRRKSESIKRALADPRVRQHRSEAMQRAWADPTVRHRRTEAQRRPEVRARKSQSMKRTLSDPKMHQRMSEASKQTWADPEIRERRNEGLKRALSDPDVQKRLSEGLKASWTRERRAAFASRSAKIWRDREVALKEARWRPADWRKKPPLWRVVAEILLSRDGYMSNKELGEIMDAQLIRCEYGQSWRAALSSIELAQERIRLIRRWIGRPGKHGFARL